MKKVGIITHYDVHNHGAVLQLNALVQILKQKGCDAKALQFEKNYDFLGIDKRYKYELSFKSIPIYIKYIFQRGINCTWFNYRKRKILETFKKDQSLLGEYYTSYDFLNAVIIGSDEVFALHTGPTPVFWGHALPSDNIISYAGSFGPTTIEDIYKKKCAPLVESGLRSLRKISVRDDNSFNIVKDLIGNKNVEKVCDPVILYGYEEEIRVLPKVREKPYLLVYSYDSNMNNLLEINKIRSFAKKHDLMIISPGFYHKWCDKNINIDPITLLSYFRDAQFVITDTFHGVVMSIITMKNMAVKIRGNSNKLSNLLIEYGIYDQMINSDFTNLEELYGNSISWKDVNDEVLKRRAFSMNFLLNSISI